MIRPIQQSDAAAIHAINRDSLGYDLDLSVAKIQLEKLMQDHHHYFLVAEENGRAVGYIHAQLYETLYFKPLFNLMALAVATDYQRQGIGRSLLSALEELAQQSQIAGIRVNSGIARKGAHAFYRSLGYQDRPDQKRFLKEF